MEDAGGEESLDAQGAAKPGCSGHRQAPGKPVWSLLEEAAHMKTEGNAFYREKNIRSAIGRYHRALLILRSLDSDVTSSVKGFGPEITALTPEQEAFLRNTQVDCYNNIAACLLQKQSVDYARVREYSLRVLQLRPGNVKALYRAGLAALEMGDAQTAKEYLSQACREQPNGKRKSTTSVPSRAFPHRSHSKAAHRQLRAPVSSHDAFCHSTRIVLASPKTKSVWLHKSQSKTRLEA
uniref:Tetratricopeptide repeat protein 9C n=1 Tax=Mastacembelus armatus TaxID=205130 RepID=A0A3Q3KII5_9TELE